MRVRLRCDAVSVVSAVTGHGWTKGHTWLDAAQQASTIFIIYLKNAYQIRKRFLFVFSLPFPASEPNASIAACRCLRFPAQVGPCFFSHLLPISFLICSLFLFLVFLAVVSSFFIMNKHYSCCRAIVFWFFSLPCYCCYYGYNSIGMTDLIYRKQVWQVLFFGFSRCLVIAFLKGH